ncbi:MAG: hypothetical protein IJV45_07020 [Prevotella sp.]|nr:hypothetical protein [Prevotella sp.]
MTGTIDLRTEQQSSRECLFRAQGESDFRTFLPGDIKGFRLLNDGAYYVTRTLPVGGVDKTFFAEYLLQGGVSLYRLADNHQYLYYLVDEQGQVAVVREYELTEGSVADNMQLKREALLPAVRLLEKSEKACQRLWNSHIGAESLVEIVRQYDNEFCQSAGDCVEFRYDHKAAESQKVHFRAEAGWRRERVSAFYRSWAGTPELGLGVDCLFPRFSRSLSMQCMVFVSKWSKSGNFEEAKSPIHNPQGHDELRFIQLQERVGATYHFLPDAPVGPHVKGGVTINEFFCNKGDFDTELMFGCYLGIGASVNVGSHRVDVSVCGSTNENLFRLSDTPKSTLLACEVSLAFVL